MQLTTHLTAPAVNQRGWELCCLCCEVGERWRSFSRRASTGTENDFVYTTRVIKLKKKNLSSFLAKQSALIIKGHPAISRHSFQGSGDCYNDRQWWSAGHNGISLLRPACTDMTVSQSWPTVSDWGYKELEFWASLNEITVHGSCQSTSRLTPHREAGQE